MYSQLLFVEIDHLYIYLFAFGSLCLGRCVLVACILVSQITASYMKLLFVTSVRKVWIAKQITALFDMLNPEPKKLPTLHKDSKIKDQLALHSCSTDIQCYCRLHTRLQNHVNTSLILQGDTEFLSTG